MIKIFVGKKVFAKFCTLIFQGWHVPCRGYPIPELSSAELDDFLIRMAPYGARIMGILRHTALDYPVLNTERGDKLRGILEEVNHFDLIQFAIQFTQKTEEQPIF